MKKYFKYLIITMLITILITLIYLLIDFEIPNLFYNKLQITMLPGLIFMYKGIRMIASNSSSGYQDIYISKKINQQTQNDIIKDKTVSNFTSKYIMLAYITSGIIQILFGILIGKIGTL